MPKKKKKRKHSPQVTKEFVVPEIPQKPMKSIDKLAWQIARAMAQEPVDKTNCNAKVYCPSCKKTYCLGFDMVDQYCKGETDCFYYPCVKEHTGRRTCQKCAKFYTVGAAFAT